MLTNWFEGPIQLLKGQGLNYRKKMPQRISNPICHAHKSLKWMENVYHLKYSQILKKEIFYVALTVKSLSDIK